MWLRNLFDHGDEILTNVWEDKGDSWSPKDVFTEEERQNKQIANFCFDFSTEDIPSHLFTHPKSRREED